MNYHYSMKDLLNADIQDKDIKEMLEEYFLENKTLLEALYFKPKKIEETQIREKLQNEDYLRKVENTIANARKINIEQAIPDSIQEIAESLQNKGVDQDLYIILGLDTTTIYAVPYQGRVVTVLLLESTMAEKENIQMLLAHEYTHWLRGRAFRHDIFESCVGERLVTEGIACNFSEKTVPNKEASYYCIVPKQTVTWVENNMEKLEELMKDRLDKNELIYDFFYMFANTSLPDMPVRTGYVYGYLKVKEYMKYHHKTIEELILEKWEVILGG